MIVINRIRYATGILAVTLVVFMVGLFIGQVNAADTIRLFINGTEVFGEVSPVVQNDRVLVPIRLVAENLGCNVNWDANARIVYVDKEAEEPVVTNPPVEEETPAVTGNNWKYITLNGQLTTWPYWYEGDTLYMEIRDATSLLIEAHSTPQNQIGFFMQSRAIVWNGKRLEFPDIRKDGYLVVSVKYLKNQDFLNYDFDPETGIMTLKPVE